jgi:hypothetical protein
VVDNAYYFPVHTIFSTHDIPARLRTDGSYFPEAGHRLSTLCRCNPTSGAMSHMLDNVGHYRLFKEEES